MGHPAKEDLLRELNRVLTYSIAPPLTPEEALDLVEDFACDVDAVMEGLKSDIKRQEDAS